MIKSTTLSERPALHQYDALRNEILYGIEAVPLAKKTRTIVKSNISQMPLLEMKMLGFSFEVTRRDEIRNELVRKEMNIGALHCLSGIACCLCEFFLTSFFLRSAFSIFLIFCTKI